MTLPNVLKGIYFNGNDKNVLLISAEGFESRTAYWIDHVKGAHFKEAILCRYEPKQGNINVNMQQKMKNVVDKEVVILNYDRFEPALFERKFREAIIKYLDYDAIYIDISVMSKLLILIVVNELRHYNKKINIIYVEPKNWSPELDEFQRFMNDRKIGDFVGLSSVGIYDLIKTPGLSSVVMQNHPMVLITFFTFNEQLMRTLIESLNPTYAIFFNTKCERLNWREKALNKLYESLVKEYDWCNESDVCNQLLNSYSLEDYSGVFAKLAEIYRKYCYDNRIVVAPDGPKMHALACALLKVCCSDVHIEYPTPEHYIWEKYSTDAVWDVYNIHFENFSDTMKQVAENYGLNG